MNVRVRPGLLDCYGMPALGGYPPLSGIGLLAAPAPQTGNIRRLLRL